MGGVEQRRRCMEQLQGSRAKATDVQSLEKKKIRPSVYT